MKAVVTAFNKEKVLVRAFSVIVQLHRLIVYSTSVVLCYALWTWNQIKVIYYITGRLLMGGQCYNGATGDWALKDCFWRDFSFPSGNKININPDW